MILIDVNSPHRLCEIDLSGQDFDLAATTTIPTTSPAVIKAQAESQTAHIYLDITQEEVAAAARKTADAEAREATAFADLIRNMPTLDLS